MKTSQATQATIVLPKGESIKFLDYTIKNFSNNDGLVLFKEGYLGYESHLGNYGKGTSENLDACKRYAILYFMAARPQYFADIMVRKAGKQNSGTYHEYYKFKNVCEREGIELPADITPGDGSNCMIYFKGEPLTA